MKLADNFMVNVILQIAASSNAVFMKLQDAGGQGSILFNLSNMERAEKEPLLSHLGTHCRS